MINALFSISPRSAYEILSIRFNGIGSSSRLDPVAAGEWHRALARPGTWFVA
jgi:hypothetical protein